jgi:acyl dehydratase
VAPPTFGVTFAMKPFALACSDPELGIDLVRLLHAEQEFEHGAPVRPGDELTTEGEIVEIRSRGPLEFLAVRTETVNGAGERVLVARWTAVVRR